MTRKRMPNKMPADWQPLIKACGSVSELAKKIGVSAVTVSRWATQTSVLDVHAERVREVAAELGVQAPSIQAFKAVTGGKDADPSLVPLIRQAGTASAAARLMGLSVRGFTQIAASKSPERVKLLREKLEEALKNAMLS